MKIYLINGRQLDYLQHAHNIGDSVPKVFWMHKGVDTVVAIDNTSGDFWTEQFCTEYEAKRWMEVAEREVKV